MTTKVLDAEKTLDTMIELRNNNAKAAAYWFVKFGHEDTSYKTCAVTATAMSDMISILFKIDEDFTTDFVEDEMAGVKFNYNKFRRI